MALGNYDDVDLGDGCGMVEGENEFIFVDAPHVELAREHVLAVPVTMSHESTSRGWNRCSRAAFYVATIVKLGRVGHSTP